MSIEEPHRRNCPTFRTHRDCHEAILANEHWFGDGKPELGERFTAAKTRERKTEIISILYRAVKRECCDGALNVAKRLEILTEQLFNCRKGHRCGSSACPECLRAFQKAKAAAQEAAIRRLQTDRIGKLLVMVTVVPLDIRYEPKELTNLNIRKLNRLLKDRLTRAGLSWVILGSLDLSWEDEFFQPHWHLGLWTSETTKLGRRLKSVFQGKERGDRPVVVSKTRDLKFIPYKHKLIKLPNLLRNNRRHLPYLLLTLDQIEPLELLVLFRVRMSAQDGGLEFKELTPRQKDRS